MAKYLDETGVATLWQKCKDTFQPKPAKEFISLDAVSDIELDSTNGLQLNKWYRIDGTIEFKVSAASSSGYSTAPTTSVSYRSIHGAIFKLTAVHSGTRTSSPYAQAYVYITYRHSGMSSSSSGFGVLNGDISASSSAGNYSKSASATARYQGIITQLN